MLSSSTTSIKGALMLALMHKTSALADQTFVGLANRAASSQLPAIAPPPRNVELSGAAIGLDGQVTIVGKAIDQSILDAIREAVISAGGEVSLAEAATEEGGTYVFVGVGGDANTKDLAEGLIGNSIDEIPAEGYVLASGVDDKQKQIVLHGSDERGAFYASQTFRQLAVERRGFPGIKIQDSPFMEVRGSIEGFYGIPWSHQARLDQFVLYGKHKLNTYVYTPKDDLLLRSQWRDTYEGEDLENLQELVDTANKNFVDFTFALSPGNDLCYSSDDDFDATITKFEQLRQLGVRRFYLALDDIPTDKFHCEADEKKWPLTDDQTWLAEAQTYYLNRLQKEFIEAHDDLDDLETVPTNYQGSGPEPYKEIFGKTLNSKVRVQWTGEGVFSPNITVASVTRAAESYVTDNLFIWDNFPVNDGDFSRLFLNPLMGRDRDLYQHIIGFTSNPMQQPYASMLALINYGDYCWNPLEYDAQTSLDGGISELAGSDQEARKALDIFVDLNQNWPYREPQVFAPDLSGDIKAFWAARDSSGSGRNTALVDRLDAISNMTQSLKGIDMQGFAEDAKPWSTAAGQWANACLDLIAMLDAIDGGDDSEAKEKLASAKVWIEKTKEKTIDTLDREGNPDTYAPNIGDGKFQEFTEEAMKIYDQVR